MLQVFSWDGLVNAYRAEQAITVIDTGFNTGDAKGHHGSVYNRCRNSTYLVFRLPEEIEASGANDVFTNLEELTALANK